MNLQLERPLVVFDLETTGLNIVEDRIIEIAYLIIQPDGAIQQRSYRFNPGMPIPPQSTAIHGITDADVAQCDTFAQHAAAIYADFQGCDLCGYNSDHFDIPFLVEELLRCAINVDFSQAHTIDVQTIFHKMEPRTLEAAVRYYCATELEDAHTALADASATWKVLEGQLQHYGTQLPQDVSALSDFTRRKQLVDFAGRMIYDENGDEVFNFGKYKGQRVCDVLQRDKGFYNWMMQGNFPRNTKQMLTKIKLRVL